MTQIDLDQVLRRVSEAADRGLREAADHVLEIALRHVPIEDRTLARSGKVSQDTTRHVSAVSFDTIYAVWQHEDMRFEHDAGRTSKYLENAFNSERGEVAQIIARRIRTDLGG